MNTSTQIFGVAPTGIIKDEITAQSTIAPVIGVRFPLFDPSNSAKGLFVKTQGFELIKSMVRQFIKTERGERVMLPNFGLSLRRFLFEPITPDLIQNIENEIYLGFNRYLPMVRILDLKIFSGDDVQGFGLPGLKVNLLISPLNTNEQAEISVNL